MVLLYAQSTAKVSHTVANETNPLLTNRVPSEDIQRPAQLHTHPTHLPTYHTHPTNLPTLHTHPTHPPTYNTSGLHLATRVAPPSLPPYLSSPLSVSSPPLFLPSPRSTTPINTTIGAFIRGRSIVYRPLLRWMEPGPPGNG